MAEAKVYVIATPLGNVRDITLRAVDILRELDCFFAEDTRELKKLLNLLEIPLTGKDFFSYAKHNMKESTERALGFLELGKAVGVLTDRGTPGVSDPGSLLVRAARDAGFPVLPVPGPSSPAAALSVAGMDSDAFYFAGFLPDGAQMREKLWQQAESGVPMIFFEAPRRIHKTLTELKGRFSGAELFIAREMTKHFESYDRVELDTLEVESIPDKGEFTVILRVQESTAPAGEPEIERELEERLLSEKEWSKRAASRLGISSSEIYNRLQRLKKERT